jgi:hypothetical protein
LASKRTRSLKNVEWNSQQKFDVEEIDALGEVRLQCCLDAGTVEVVLECEEKGTE